MRNILITAALGAGCSPAALPPQDLKIALIYGKTGPLEAYAKQTETGLRDGPRIRHQGHDDGRRPQDRASSSRTTRASPTSARPLLAEAYEDDKVDIAIGTTSSAAALAMLPVAEEYKKILIVEPAVADQITGEKWNRYIFRTGAQLARRTRSRTRSRSASRA